MFNQQGAPPHPKREPHGFRRKGIAVAGLLALATSALAASPSFAAGGAGGSGGNNGGPGSNPGAASYFFDNPLAPGSYEQGTGQASIDTFIANSGILTRGPGVGSPAIVANARATVQNDCTTALSTASQRGGFGNDISRSRVVGFMWAISSAGFVGTPLPNVGPQRFHEQINNWQGSGYPGFYFMDVADGVMGPQTYQLGTDMINQVAQGGNVTFVCIALNETEPAMVEPEYDLSMSTQIGGAFPQAGTNTPITETVSTNRNGSALGEDLAGTATLSWGGYPNSNVAVTHASKPFTVHNEGSTTVTWTPADFGWAVWPGGKFWTSSSIDQQGSMSSGPVTHGGPDIATQMFEATPPSPSKHLTNPNDGVDIGDNPQVGPGQTINANIRMNMSGANVAHIKDVLTDGRVWLGGATADDTAGIYVLDNNGQRVTSGVTITIAPTASGGKEVVARVEGQTMIGTYTLVVPTTPWAEAGDYTFADRGEACYGATPVDDCLTTDPKNPGQVTPDPNKVWVLDESGALVEADPNHTNDQGVDNMGFVPGDSVSAVVNGSIKERLAIALSAYSITDDWTAAAPYVDFSQAQANARVFLDGVNVTNQFDIVTTGTTTTATAKTGSQFLLQSAGRTTPGVVKLVITGEIKAIDTKGEEITFSNGGSESWNNAPRETNDPSIFVRTPDPNKVWVLDENGALTTGDPEWENDKGADNKVFLHGDKVGAVVNGSLPRNLATNLSNYQIRDDWTDAAKYVDFSDPAKVKVFVGGADRTADFDITVDGTVTTATAKASFLATTGGQPNNREVKLYVFGAFKQLTEETDTQGAVIRMTNAGSETWNTDTKPTNEPPVFIWNPDPQKDVLGSAQQGGDQGSINGQMVFPGQIIEYQVDLDLRIPADTAYDINNFQVEDNYSEYFVPNKSSLEIYDARTNKAIPRTNWTVQWNDDVQQFVVTFKPEWVKEFVGNDNPGWLIMRFDGRITDTTPPGSVAENIAYEILNESRTPTPIPVVSVPPTEPAKEDLRCDVLDDGSYANCADIDGKYVLQGDYIDYRLTLDARPAADKIAYDVHKLGLVDEYDGDYLTVNPEDVRVINSVTGEDVTDRFNVQVNPDEAHDPNRFSHASTDSGATDENGEAGEGAASGKGVVYVFAKSYGYVSPITGEQVGPTEAEFEAYNAGLDLAEYATSDIAPLEDAIIDQELLGSVYKVYLRTKVAQETNDYTIRNEAFQNFENMVIRTRIVSNPQKVIDPAKDVSIEVGGPSINNGEVPLSQQWEADSPETRSYFNYLLKSSTIPADRAYESRNWNIVDDYDQTHDRYTGQWVVQATEDVFDADGELIVAKGEKIADSEGFVLGAGNVVTLPNGKLPVLGQSSEGSDEGTLVANASGVILEAKDGKWVKAVQQGFGGLFTVADAAGVLTVTANQAYLDLVNLNLDKAAGWQVYVQFERIAPGTVHNTFTETYNDVPRDPNEVITHTPQNPAIKLVKFDVASGVDEGDRDEVEQALWVEQGRPTLIGFTYTNVGDVPLKETALTDATINDTLGTIDMSAKTCSVELEGYILHPGDSITCFATLSGLTAEQLEDGSWKDLHSNLAKVTAKSVFPNEDGTYPEVSDENPWNARVEALDLEITKFDRETGIELGDRNTPEEGLVYAEGEEPIIDFLVENNSNSAMTGLRFTDTTIGGYGTVEDITFSSEQGEIRPGTAEESLTVPVLDKDGNPVLGENGEPVVETEQLEGILVLVAEDGTLSKLVLAPGETFTASGVLKGLQAGQTHTDNATIEGVSVNTGKTAEDEDPWNGEIKPLDPTPTPTPTPSTENPAPTPTKPTPGKPGTNPSNPGGIMTGEGEGDINPLTIGLGALLLLGAAAGTTAAVRRRRGEQLENSVSAE